MNDLLHFVPLTETVTVRGTKIKLRGVELEDLGQIFFRFPEISAMIEKRQFDIANAGVSKQAIVAMIVAGAGHAGDEAMEKSFANLSLGERASLFKSVFRLTAPGGIGPFVELVQAATGQGLAEPATEAAPKKKKSGIKVQLQP
jgi:hypothetical protein